MRQERLTAYVLHCLPYQEKKAIYQLFSQEHGMVRGVFNRGMPSFVLMELFASGKTNLKTLSKCSPVSGYFEPVAGQVQYALLYLNEILCKLLVLESPSPNLWQAYHEHLTALKVLGYVGLDDDKMQVVRLLLRSFERALFEEFGVSLALDMDCHGRMIEPDASYFFVPEMGLVPVVGKDNLPSRSTKTKYIGADLLQMATHSEQIHAQKLTVFGHIQKAMVDYLLDYRPLNSRTLWQQSQRYQKA